MQSSTVFLIQMHMPDSHLQKKKSDRKRTMRDCKRLQYEFVFFTVCVCVVVVFFFFFFYKLLQGLRVVGGVAANCWSKPGLLVNAKNR